MSRVFVSGMGIISALGIGKEATLQALCAEKSGISTINILKTCHKDILVGEVKLRDDELRKELSCNDKMITRTSLLGRMALREAITEACLEEKPIKRVAFLTGTSVGGMECTERYYTNFLSSKLNSDYIKLHDCGASTEKIAEQYSRDFCYTTTLSTACSSAANAIILGANLIKAGMVDAAVVGGAECLSKFHLNGFKTLMILDNKPCCPFDKNRRGLNLGEGASYLVLESEKSLAERKHNPLCELSGYGNACDAYHQTATSPQAEGPFLTMQEALKMSNLKPEEIDYINLHGTGTDNNDESEGVAIMRLFGDKIPYISSTKGFTGHTTSAAGAVESVISILALKNQIIPANLRFENKIESHTFQPISKLMKNVKLKHVLNNSFGFGGNDSACVFSKI